MGSQKQHCNRSSHRGSNNQLYSSEVVAENYDMYLLDNITEILK